MITEEQRLRRKEGLGGSDIAAICGANPYRSRYDVWLDKTSDEAIDITNINMEIGNALEALVAKHYEKDRNNDEIPFASKDISLFETETTYSSDYPFLLGHPDRLISDGGLLEVKIAISYPSQKQWKVGIPPYHMYQIAYYAYLTNTLYVDVAVLCIGEQRPRYYRYERDPIFEHSIVLEAISFWNNYVITNKPPLRLERVAEADLLREKGKMICVDASTLEVVQKYAEVKQVQKYLGEQESEYKEQILAYMGDNDYLNDIEGKTLASFTSHVRSLFDTTTFKKDHLDMYSRYVKQSDPVRVLKLINDKREEF